MFPFDIEDEEIEIEVKADIEPADYEIDIKTGKLTGRIITGLEAILQWARLTLSTDRYYYSQYSWDYGSEITNLIGKNYSEKYAKSEAKRMILDALSVNEHILGIEDFSCSFSGDKLTASFTINTDYGKGEINV